MNREEQKSQRPTSITASQAILLRAQQLRALIRTVSPVVQAETCWTSQIHQRLSIFAPQAILLRAMRLRPMIRMSSSYCDEADTESCATDECEQHDQTSVDAKPRGKEGARTTKERSSESAIDDSEKQMTADSAIFCRPGGDKSRTSILLGRSLNYPLQTTGLRRDQVLFIPSTSSTECLLPLYQSASQARP